LLERADELAAGDNAPVDVAHPQQALKIIYSTRSCANHGLKRKEEAVLAQRRPHTCAHRQATALRTALAFCLAEAHLLVAPGSLYPSAVANL
jgi:hypothetical protein